VTAERLAVWAVACVACVAAGWVGVVSGVPAPDERLVVIALGALAALPLVVVALAWVSSVRARRRGWT
jgi:hypothetical protein